MIRIENLHKRFGRVNVLRGVDLEIKHGGIFAILGPNGSGKTTLIKSILGMVIPDKGDIAFNGKSIIKKYSYRQQIDYLPQIAHFPANLSVNELIGMIRNLRGNANDDDRLSELFGLTPFLHQKLGNLSGGTRQKVNLVLALMFNSECLILDEPTSGLDPVSLIRLKALIQQKKQNGKTIVISSHIMSLVEAAADEFVILLDGKIYFKGTVAQLKAQTKQTDLEHAIAGILMENHA
ncbi:MAG: ABC transporter ATP-binding protein [Sinomicrobium sp.]|nr:ABC transporter ATP-binding protein [Sinomicrobium sp.]